ncbi:MAG: topoisomerase DNA-binding C4 zinc finger domain-containing protein [Clostridia bacterium]|nr:topoisomerase DNA-binding C4 zinc finger domain-containing protein [Clostridia bacterium]
MVLIFLTLIVAVITAFAVIQYINKQYAAFVLQHSCAIKRLMAINQRYEFLPIPNLDMEHCYDNERFYEAISPQDYLIYQLVDCQEKIEKAILDVEVNQLRYNQYKQDVDQIQEFDRYDIKCPFQNAKKITQMEMRLYQRMIKVATVVFLLRVELVLTKINGRYRTSKSHSFSIEEITSLIRRINQKSGVRYVDAEIWQSICRVERGKVSNKMRFAIYERDDNCCRKCGSEYDLEIDHIVPISKGGKSTYQNLQTLCHKCNVEKSNKIEFPNGHHSQEREQTSNICPWCGKALALRSGQYGMFWGCTSYPRCKFTKRYF